MSVLNYNYTLEKEFAMQISKINNTTYFTSKFFNTYSKKETDYYKKPPIDDSEKTTQYFYDIDRKMGSIPIGWGHIFNFSTQQKKDFANLISLTFKTTDDEHPYLPKEDIQTAEYAMSDFEALLNTKGILSKDEKQKILDKCLGSFELDELDKIHSRFKQKEENATNNLTFLKVLTQKENQSIFNAMSPKTITAILSEEYLDFDYYMNALSNLKNDKVLEYPEEERRNTIHIYLTGKSLNNNDSVETYDKNTID